MPVSLLRNRSGVQSGLVMESHMGGNLTESWSAPLKACVSVVS